MRATSHWLRFLAEQRRAPGERPVVRIRLPPPASLSVAVTFRPDYFLRREIRRGEMRRSEISLVSRGTDGSNPASSSGESVANLTSGRTPSMTL
jgi:hypothetical protein